MDRSRIITLLLCLGLSLGARAQEARLLRFETREQCIDTVRFDGGVITLRYPFRNVSGKTVTILEVHSTCGCFTGESSARVLAPGARAVLTAVLNPENLHGPQNRHLTVLATDGTTEKMSSLAVKGFVLRDQSEGEIRYPADLGGGLRANAGFAWLEKDAFGDHVFSFPLYNDTDREMRLELRAPSRVKFYEQPAVIGPHSRVNVRGVFDVRWKRRGSQVAESVDIRVNGEKVTPVVLKGTIQ